MKMTPKFPVLGTFIGCFICALVVLSVWLAGGANQGAQAQGGTGLDPNIVGIDVITTGNAGAESGTQCVAGNVVDDDGDGHFNDGCPAVSAAETICNEASCPNLAACDNDGDGSANDGCPAVHVLGTIDRCVQVGGVGSTFDIDVFLDDVPLSSGSYHNLGAVEYKLNYDETKLKVNATTHNWLIKALAGSVLGDYGDCSTVGSACPDTDGELYVSYLDTKAAFSEGPGSLGVLDRHTLEVVGGAGTLVYLTLTDLYFAGYEPGVTDWTAEIDQVWDGVYPSIEAPEYGIIAIAPETCPGAEPETLCKDGIDNDQDGKTDCADSDCAANPVCLPETLCKDGIDNDQDGKTDCADSDCAANPNCGAPPEELTIDIKPGSYPNPINPKSKGVIPVAILTTDAFDASDIDPASARFEERARPIRWVLSDVDHDGDLDLLLYFRTEDTSIVAGQVQACLTATTFGGITLTGCDSIKVVPAKGAGGMHGGMLALGAPLGLLGIRLGRNALEKKRQRF